MKNEIVDKLKLKEFFNHEKLIKIKDKVLSIPHMYITGTYNKYEYLYEQISKTTNYCILNGANGLFWIVTSPKVGNLLEIGFPNAIQKQHNDQIIMGLDPYCIGTLNNKWLVYVDPQWPENELLIGANWTENPDPKHMRRIYHGN